MKTEISAAEARVSAELVREEEADRRRAERERSRGPEGSAEEKEEVVLGSRGRGAGTGVSEHELSERRAKKLQGRNAKMLEFACDRVRELAATVERKIVDEKDLLSSGKETAAVSSAVVVQNEALQLADALHSDFAALLQDGLRLFVDYCSAYAPMLEAKVNRLFLLLFAAKTGEFAGDEFVFKVKEDRKVNQGELKECLDLASIIHLCRETLKGIDLLCQDAVQGCFEVRANQKEIAEKVHKKQAERRARKAGQGDSDRRRGDLPESPRRSSPVEGGELLPEIPAGEGEKVKRKFAEEDLLPEIPASEGEKVTALSENEKKQLDQLLK